MSAETKHNLRVRDVMLPLDMAPIIRAETLFKEALVEMGRTHLGIACIVDADGRLLGILTDGDIRRKLLKVQKPFSALFVDDALDHAIRSPITIGSDDTLSGAVGIMSQKKIWDLPVVDGGKLVGLLHLHPAIQVLLGLKS